MIRQNGSEQYTVDLPIHIGGGLPNDPDKWIGSHMVCQSRVDADPDKQIGNQMVHQNGSEWYTVALSSHIGVWWESTKWFRMATVWLFSGRSRLYNVAYLCVMFKSQVQYCQEYCVPDSRPSSFCVTNLPAPEHFCWSSPQVNNGNPVAPIKQWFTRVCHMRISITGERLRLQIFSMSVGSRLVRSIGRPNPRKHPICSVSFLVVKNFTDLHPTFWPLTNWAIDSGVVVHGRLRIAT